MAKAFIIMQDGVNQVSSFVRSVYVGENAKEEASKELKHIKSKLEQIEQFYVREPIGQINTIRVDFEDEDGHLSYHSFYKIVSHDISTEFEGD